MGEADKAPCFPMTTQQSTVLPLLCDGLTSRQIADRLHLSHKTVEFHRSNLLKMFGVSNTVQLVRLVVRRGLIDP
jgi:DNA-binding NarL/FixJ family response regulator